MTNSASIFAEKFDRSEAYYRSWLADLTDDVDTVLTESRARFLKIGPTLAYTDEPDHPMAFSLFTCAALLCLFLSLRERGVDVHAFGARMLQALTDAMTSAPSRSAHANGETAGSAAEVQALEASVSRLISAGERSRAEPETGAFQFDVRWVDEATGHWRMEMSSCGICHLFGQHDAMDLVPYMCATDDVMSDVQNQGLARTGTIALGSGCCDFDYRSGRPTAAIADLYPERIRLIDNLASGAPV